MKSFGDMVKQAQKLQKQMSELQERLSEDRYEATAGGGMVTAIVDGKQMLKELKIKPDALEDSDITLLEDLIITAVSDAQRRSEAHMQEAMGALTGLAALLTAIQFIDVQTNAGVGLEMKVIAAVVVGGTAISGGRGTLPGTLLGIALLGAIGPALTFLGTEAHWERALQGLVILLAVAADALQTRGSRARH